MSDGKFKTTAKPGRRVLFLGLFAAVSLPLNSRSSNYGVVTCGLSRRAKSVLFCRRSYDCRSHPTVGWRVVIPKHPDCDVHSWLKEVIRLARIVGCSL